MSPHIKQLKKINFKYWNEQNNFTAYTPVSSSQVSMLNLLKKRGYLEDFKPKKGIDYANIINKNISHFKNGSNDDKTLVNTFDLIQAWGGINGRNPYVKRKLEDSTVRDNFDNWKENYIKGAKFALKDETQKALEKWFQIPQLSMGFASKHLFFWSNQNHPILDTRISLILTGEKLSTNSKQYIRAENLISELSNYFNTTKVETEKAIFVFSLNFFHNSNLTIKENPENLTDIEIAEAISLIK